MIARISPAIGVFSSVRSLQVDILKRFDVGPFRPLGLAALGPFVLTLGAVSMHESILISIFCGCSIGPVYCRSDAEWSYQPDRTPPDSVLSDMLEDSDHSAQICARTYLK